MISRGFAVFLLNYLGFAFQAHIDFILGVLKVDHVDFFLVPLGGQQGSLIYQVFKISA